MEGFSRGADEEEAISGERAALPPDGMRLMKDLAQVFSSLGATPSDALGQGLMRHSRLYRAVIGAHLERLAAEEGTVGVEKEGRRQRQRAAEYHVMWYLCEILYVASDEEASVTASLLDWIHMTAYPDVSLLRRLQAGSVRLDDPTVLPQMQHLTRTFVLQGCFREAAVCLDMLASHNRNPIEAQYQRVAGALLQETPLVTITTSIREFMPRFRLWQAKCSQLWEASRHDQCASVSEILAIMSGDEPTLIASKCSWVDLLIANLLYVDPSQQRSHLRELAHRCVVTWKSETIASLPPYQRILYAVFSDDIVAALQVTAQFSQPWFPAHLCDLLFHAGCLPAADGEEGRAVMLMAHADGLGKSGMLPLALQYFDAVGSPQARARMALLMEGQKVETEEDMQTLFALCKRYALLETGASLARSFAEHRWALAGKGSLHEAVQWAVQAGDEALAARMVFAAADRDGLDSFLVDSSGTLAGGGVTGEPTSPAQQFIYYCSLFRQARMQGAHAEAAHVLVRLVGDQVAPSRFWLELFLKCAPLFEEPALLWSPAQLQVLMRRLEMVMGEVVYATQDNVLRLQALQLAVCRCAARVLVNQKKN